VSNMSERKLLIMTIAVSVLLTGVLLYFVFSDRSEIEGVNEEIDGLDARLQAAEIERRKIPTREDKVLQYRAVEEAELAVLPTEQRIADFHRNISTFLSQSDISFQELPESSAEDSELAKGIRVTRNSIKGAGTSAAILKFINMIENDPRLISVKGYKIQGGDIDSDDLDAPVEHEFKLNLETYFYRPGKGAIRREHIPGAEERLQQPKLRAAIAAFQPERPDSYVLRPAVSRRDPLVDPRRAKEIADPEEQARLFRKQEETVIELENHLRIIAELAEKQKALERVGDLFRLDRIRTEITEKVNALRASLEQELTAKSVTIAELQSRIEVLTENVNRIRGTMSPEELVVTRAVADNVLEDMSELLDAGDYHEMVSLGGSWTSFLRGKKRMPESEPVIEQIAVLRDRAKTLGEFASKSFQVTGVIVDTADPERSIACINGAYLRAGDTLDEKGEVIPRPIGRSGPNSTKQNAKPRTPRDRRKARR